MLDAWWEGDPLIRFTRWMPHIPTPTQHAFLYLDDFEVLFGGAAGGGKSDTLLEAAAQYVDVPGYAALIIRKSYKDLSLPGAIMSRSKEWWLGTDVKWNDTEKTWTFPSGATITFGYLQSKDDVYQYQGAEFQFIGVDELTQLPFNDYRYLRSRLRRPNPPGWSEQTPEGQDPELDTREDAKRRLLSQVPLRMRGATNPGGKSHKEFRRHFIDKRPDPDDPEDTQAKANKRIFVPSKLADNPHVDQEAYREALSGLDARTRAQLLDGDWTVREPGEWVFDDAALAVAKQLGLEMDKLWRERKIAPVGGTLQLGIDFGTHTHVIVGCAMQGGGTYFAKEVQYDGPNVLKAVPQTVAHIKGLGYPVSSYRYDASMPGLATIFYDELCKQLGYKIKIVTPVPFGKLKRKAIQHQNYLLDNTAEGKYPQLAISPVGCPTYLEQAERLFYDNPEIDAVHKEDDHGPDAGFSFLTPDAHKRDKRTKEKVARASR